MGFDWKSVFRTLLRQHQQQRDDVAYAKFLRIHRRKLQRIWGGESEIAHDTVRTALERLDVCYCRICERECPYKSKGHPSQSVGSQLKGRPVAHKPWNPLEPDLPSPVMAFVILLRSIWAEISPWGQLTKATACRVKVNP